MAKEWSKLRNEQLHNLYVMIKLRRESWVGHLTYRREERSSYKVFVGKPEVNKPLLGLGREMRIISGVQLKSGLYFNTSNLFTNIYNMLYYTTNLYIQ
jgi:hypothetical protein